VEAFRSYTLPIDGLSAKNVEIVGFFLATFLRVGDKYFEMYDIFIPHEICLQISWQSVKGWLSTIVCNSILGNFLIFMYIFNRQIFFRATAPKQ